MNEEENKKMNRLRKRIELRQEPIMGSWPRLRWSLVPALSRPLQDDKCNRHSSCVKIFDSGILFEIRVKGSHCSYMTKPILGTVPMIKH